MNIRPGVYLTCLYAALLVVILFAVFVRPGIVNSGSVLTVNSEPWGAAVLVDGVYAGSTPGDFFVPRGRRTIELRLPGFTPQTIEQNVGGRVFASALFPRRMAISATLESPDPAAAFIEQAAEFTAWTFAGEPTAAHQIPLSLSEAAYRLAHQASPDERESMRGVIQAAARFAVTQASLRDLIRAQALADNGGLSPSPLSLLVSTQGFIALLDENPAAALALGELLTAGTRSALTGSAWYARANAAQSAANASTATGAAGGQTLQAGGLNFRRVHGGTIGGRNFPAGTAVDTFYISETLVTQTSWELFLARQPQWRRENASALVQQGLAQPGHLQNVSIPGAPTGVSSISWHTAVAYCQWLTGLLPPGYTSWEVRLPTEAEWEYAAGAGLLNTGLFWEWCQDPFAPLSFISAPAEAAALGSPERPLRGGSWVNPPSSVDNQTRGSLPPSFSSPFVSFRPVIAPKGNQP